ncbi:Na(+)/H(+) antiporter subunit B [Actinomadura geliboluensis]|uniref:Na(+)/H(+) antiporter subunit B n=1 Tax=Actinomadura geliboluensis TaxID=882440 RepID=UPI0036D00805
MTAAALTTVLQAIALTLAGVLAVGTVLVRDPLRQVVAFSLFGLSLVMVFALLMAPDVAIAEIAVSSIGVPMVLLPVIYKTHGGGKG